MAVTAAEIFRLYYDDKIEVRKICTLTKLSSRTIYEVINASGRGKRRNAVFYPNQVADLYRHGFSIAEVIDLVGCSSDTVRRLATEMGVKMRGRGPRRKRVPAAELDLSYNF